jgi:hypothetical protein
LEGQEIQHGRQRRRYEHPIMHGVTHCKGRPRQNLAP